MREATHTREANCVDEPARGALDPDAARARMLAAVRPVAGREVVALAGAVGRVLEAPLCAPLAVPGHRNAAVDGWAVRGADLPPPGATRTLRVAGEARAGHPFVGALPPGHAVGVTTGAVVPEAADTVLMLEHVRLAEGCITLGDRHRPGENVRQAGEDLAQGSVALPAGRRLSPADVGILASLGLTELTVRRAVRVAVLSTGDELAPANCGARPGQIYDSNRAALLTALAGFGARTCDLGIVPDCPEALAEALAEGARSADLVLSTGGVSVGAADFVRTALADVGSVDLWKIAIKPGRPLAFGRLGESLFFGLPGNPAAVWVTYALFVLPALTGLAGLPPHQAFTVTARLTGPLDKKPGRAEFPRGLLRRGAGGDWQVTPFAQQGSGILRSMSEGDALIHLPREAGPRATGDRVAVEPFFSWPGWV